MRKILIFLVTAFLMTGFTSCKKDKDGDLPNTLEIGTKSYKMAAACCYSYEIENINKYNLFLTSKVTWNYTGDMTTNTSSYANGFEVNLHYLYANGSSLNELPSGRYKYGDEYESFTHSGDSDYMFYDANGKPGRWVDMGQRYAKNSKLVIDVKHINDNIYEIKFSGAVDYDGKTVNGYYKGEIDFYRPR